MQEAILEYRKWERTANAPKLTIRSLALQHRVDNTTLGRLLRGGVSLSEHNAKKRHLTPNEERVLLDFTKDQAKRGFPLSHRLLRERANAILRTRKGITFSVGRSWVSRFLSTHSDEISVYWSRSLDRARKNGLQETAVGWYYDTLEKLDRENDIPQENWYGADETAMALGLLGKEEVIGPAGQKMQYKVQDGDREMVTALETICADGSTLRPTVIFKGKNLLQKWGRDNPCEAS